LNRFISVIVMMMFLSGCSGIKPWKPPNHREEGPPGGLFTGPEGAWTIGVGGSQPVQPGSPPPSLLRK